MTKIFWKKVRRVFSYALPYWKLFAILFFLSVVMAGISLVNPYLVKILLDDVLINKNYGLLVILMSFFVFVFFFKEIVGIWFSYKSELLEESVVLGLKKDLFSHVEALDLGYLQHKQLGDIITRLDEDVYSFQDLVGIFMDDILMNTLTGIFILVVCLSLNWKVTLASLGFFPFYIIAQKYYGEKIKKQRKKIVKKGYDLLSFMQEMVTSIVAIQTFVLEKIELKKYVKKTQKLINADLKLNLLESYAGAVINFITFTPMLIILWYGGYQVIEGALTVGSLMALYTYVGRLFGPIAALGSINIAIQSTMVSVDRVFEFLDRKPKVRNRPNSKSLKNIKGEIEFKDVSFYYNRREPVLKNVSFKVKPGESIGIVGPSGSGKSTIASLLSRFYDPSSGSIILDGIDLRDIKLESLRKNVGIVSQETILFNASIKDNLRLGKLDATDQEIEKACKLANIHKFIASEQHGYDSRVGERGVNLSGGQKQRLSIARTILKDPQIIILDEATSSLDSKSEKQIQESLERVTKNKTTFIIAHRLSTLRDVDKVVVLDNHSLAEFGSFDELMKKKGLFYQFYNIQKSAGEEIFKSQPRKLFGGQNEENPGRKRSRKNNI